MSGTSEGARRGAQKRWANTTTDERRANTAKAKVMSSKKRRAGSELVQVAEKALVAAGATVTWPND